MPRDVKDIAKLAGLLEGEGCFRMDSKKGRPGRYPQIMLAMTDEDVVRWAGSVMDAPVYGPYQRVGMNKPKWQFCIGSYRAIGWMMTLYSLLGIRRRQKIREIISAWRLTPQSNEVKIRLGDRLPTHERISGGRIHRRKHARDLYG